MWRDFPKKKPVDKLKEDQLYEARTKLLEHLAYAEDKKAESEQHAVLAAMYSQRIVRLTKEIQP